MAPRAGDGEDPPTVRDDPVTVQRGACVEDERTGRLGLLDAVDRRALVAALGIVARRDHDCHGRVVGGRELDASGVAGRGSGERADEIALDAGQERLRLGVAEAAVELEHARAALGEHHPGEEHADERRVASCELGEHRRVDRLHELLHVDVGAHGENEPMPPVFGPSSPSNARLKSRADGSGIARDAVAERKHRHLRSFEELLDDERLLESRGRPRARRRPRPASGRRRRPCPLRARPP